MLLLLLQFFHFWLLRARNSLSKLNVFKRDAPAVDRRAPGGAFTLDASGASGEKQPLLQLYLLRLSPIMIFR